MDRRLAAVLVLMAYILFVLLYGRDVDDHSTLMGRVNAFLSSLESSPR